MLGGLKCSWVIDKIILITVTGRNSWLMIVAVNNGPPVSQSFLPSWSRIPNPDPQIWMNPDPILIRNTALNALFFFFFFLNVFDMNLFVHCVMRCAPSSRICPDPGAGWHPGEPKELQHCQQNPQRKGLKLFSNNTLVHPACATHYKPQKHKIYIIKANQEWMRCRTTGIETYSRYHIWMSESECCFSLCLLMF